MKRSEPMSESYYYILLCLAKGANHGYGIMQRAEELSHGRVRLAAGTLYGALTTLCDIGWILQLPTEDGSRRKEYRLTDRGWGILQAEVRRLRELADNGENVLKEDAL